MPVRCSYHRAPRGSLSTPTGVLMTHTLANTQFDGFAARRTLALTTHAEKAYKERIELCLYNIYRLSSAPMSELQWFSDKTIWPVLKFNLVGSQFNLKIWCLHQQSESPFCLMYARVTCLHCRNDEGMHIYNRWVHVREIRDNPWYSLCQLCVQGESLQRYTTPLWAATINWQKNYHVPWKSSTQIKVTPYSQNVNNLNVLRPGN